MMEFFIKIVLCQSLFFNPFSHVPLLYPLKTSENLRFSVFRGYRSGTLVENGLIKLQASRTEVLKKKLDQGPKYTSECS